MNKSSFEGLFNHFSQPNWFSPPPDKVSKKITKDPYFRHSKIICTLGNLSSTKVFSYSLIIFLKEGIQKLLKNGMDIARLNLAYLSKESQNNFLNVLQLFNNKIPLLVNLQGPTIRIGDLYNSVPIAFSKGDTVFITSNRHLKLTKNLIYCDCPALPEKVESGYKILIDEGRVILTVKTVKNETEFDFIETQEKTSDLLSSKSKITNFSMINLPTRLKNEIPKLPQNEEQKQKVIDFLQQKRDIEENLADEIFNRIIQTPEKIVPLTEKTSKFPSDYFKIKKTKKAKLIIECEVDYDCLLKPNKQIFIPRLGLKKDLNLRIIDVKDIKDVSFWAENGADFVSVPHIESQEDINEVKELIGTRDIKILAKIENYVSLQNLDEIINKADGIIIGRSVLNLSLAPAYLAFIQDYIVTKCRLNAKPVIIGGPILESMQKSQIPSRAEIADISMAISQGADGIILGSETAQGEYFEEAARMASQVCLSAEKNMDANQNYLNLLKQLRIKKLNIEKVENVICNSAIKLSLDLNSPLIIVFTKKGKTAYKVSKFRPDSIIIAITDSEYTRKYCNLGYGIQSIIVQDLSDTNKNINMYFF